MTPQEALKKAIEACGGAAPLSRHIGITVQAVSQWGVAPPSRVLAVESATKGKVTRHQLCPDLYPEETSEAAA